MDENNNRNDETVIFNPINEEQKNTQSNNSQEIYPEEIMQYEPRREEIYDDEYEYDDGQKNKNTTLIILAVVAGIIFLTTAIWAVIMLLFTSEDSIPEEPQEKIEITQKKEEPLPEEEQVEEEEIVEEEKNILYNIVFYGDSVEKEDGYYTVRAKLFNKSMKEEGEKRIIIDNDTEIIEDNKSLSLTSFISVIESLSQEAVFKGKINEDTRKIINISYSSEILEKEEPSQKEEEGIILPEDYEPPAESEEKIPETDGKMSDNV